MPKDPAHTRARSVSVSHEHENAIFLIELQEQLSALQYRDLTRTALARRVLELLQGILLQEVGSTQLSHAMGPLFNKLCGGHISLRIFADLYFRAIQVLAGEEERSVYFEPTQTVAQLERLVMWYSRRRASLQALEQSGESGEDTSIFSMELRHGVQRGALLGMEVKTALRLIGYANDSLWLKLFLERRGQRVMTRPLWSSWSTTPELLLPAQGEVTRELCAVWPLLPDGERIVADGIKLFLPYAALDLPTGKHQLNLVLCLCDAVGNEIARKERPELLVLEGRDKEVVPFPAPQALTLWPADYISGDAISRVRTEVRYSFQHSGNLLEINHDLELCGHEDEDVEVQLRMVRHNGDVVPARGSEDYFFKRLTLRPERPYVYYEDISFEVPLNLFSPDDQAGLFAEIAVVGPYGRVLCGTVERPSF